MVLLGRKKLEKKATKTKNDFDQIFFVCFGTLHGLKHEFFVQNVCISVIQMFVHLINAQYKKVLKFKLKHMCRNFLKMKVVPSVKPKVPPLP